MGARGSEAAAAKARAEAAVGEDWERAAAGKDTGSTMAPGLAQAWAAAWAPGVASLWVRSVALRMQRRVS